MSNLPTVSAVPAVPTVPTVHAVTQASTSSETVGAAAAEKVEAKTPFYKTAGFWFIIIGLIVLIIVGIFVYIEISNVGLNATVLGLYIFGIILLVIGVIASVS